MNTMKKKFLQVFPLFLLFFFLLYSNPNLKTKILASSNAPKNTTNFEYTFTSIKGENISTLTNSKQTTVLIFGHINCSNSRNTVKNIANSEWVHNSNIRVIFAECNYASLEQTKAFAQAYGNDAITFCYDTNYYGNITTAMWNYYDLYFDASAGGTLPFTVLIDENNKVQKVLTGNQSADTILREIQAFTILDNEETKTNVNLEIAGTENYTYVNEVLDLVNQTRNKKGLPALTLDKDLLESAMQRATENSLYYSHTRPNGSECFTVTNRGTRRSENIATGYSSPQAVMKAWNNSPGHYQNIIDPYVKSIGIGCFEDNTGNLYWTQLFDNDPAITPSISGTKQTNRIVSIQKKLLHIQTKTSQTFYDTDLKKTFSMEIYHTNENYSHIKQKLLLSNFTFKSSDHSVATINDEGIITLRGLGSTEITAFLKEDDSILLKQTITIKKKTDSNNTAAISNISSLKADSKTNNIKLTWKKISKVNGYFVYQYNNIKKKWNKIARVISNTPSYTVKSLSSGSTYHFAVKAYIIQNKKQITSKAYTSLYTATKPSTVTFRISVGNKNATLKWDKVKGATGYKIYYKTNTSDKWTLIENTKNYSYTKTKLVSGKDYFFTIKAYKTYKCKTYMGSGKTQKITIK